MRAARRPLFTLCLVLIAGAPIRGQRPEIVEQVGHANAVTSISFSPNGQLFASSDEGGLVKLWDTQRGRLLRTIEAGGADLLAFSPDGQSLASGSDSGYDPANEEETKGSVSLWDVRTGKRLFTVDIAVHESHAVAAAFNHDWTLLATAGDDNTIKLWDARSGRLMRTLTGLARPVDVLAFSRDGRTLGSGYISEFRDERGIVVPCNRVPPEAHAHLWEVESGKVLARLGGCGTIQFSLSGNLVADDEGNVYDAKSGKLLRSLGGHFAAFSPNENKAAVWADDQNLRVVDVKSGSFLYSITDFKIKNTNLFSHRETIFNPDGDTVLVWSSNSEGFELFNALNGHRLYGRDMDWFSGFSSDGRVFASSRVVGSAHRRNEVLELSSTVSGAVLARLVDEKIGDRLSRVASFSQDGTKLVADSALDNSLMLWSVPSGELIHTFQGTHNSPALSFAFSPNGKMLAVSRGFDCHQSTNYELWETHSGMLARTFRNGDVATCKEGLFGITPDSQMLRTADGRLLNLQSGAPMDIPPRSLALTSRAYAVVTKTHVDLFSSRSKRLLRRINAAGDAEFAVSSDGKLLAIGYGIADYGQPGGPRSRLLLCDLTNGRERHFDFDEYPLTHLLFSPDSKMIVVTFSTAVHAWVYNQLLDVRTGQQLTDFIDKQLDPLGREEAVEAVSTHWVSAFSPDSKIVLTDDEKLRSVPSGKVIRTVTGLRSGAGSAISSDGKILATGGAGATIEFRSVETGELLATAFSSPEGRWLVVTPDGLFDGSPDGWDQMLWRFGGDTFNVAPAEAFFNEFFYPNLLSEIFAGQRPKATQNIAQKDRRQPGVQLELTSPQPSSEGVRAARTVNLRLKVAEAAADKEHTQGSGAQDVRLFRNGSLVKVWKGDVLKGSGSVVLEANDVAIVAGHNHFQAYAFNHDNIKSADAELLVKGADSLSRKGTAYILTIGVNEYANPQFNLHYAVADAQAFSAEFKHQQEILGQYARVEVIPLQDKEATKAGILRALEQLSTKAQPEDAVIIYFAGHGTAQGNRFYLIPHDIGYSGGREAITMEGLDPILKHSISDVELQQGFEKMDAGQILLVIDACNSGQALEDEEKRRGPMNSKGLAQLAYEKGMYVLTAAQSYQAALEEAQLGHGLLTYVLVEEGLKTSLADFEPKDGEVRLREWLDYAAERVPQMQEEKLTQARAARSKLAGATAGTQKLAIQRPRIFYRRELEARSFVIARTAAIQPPK